MTPELADKIMTRIIARVEADGGVLHKSSGIEEIIGACAVAEAEGEVIDIISHDGEKGVHKDGKPLDMGDDRVEPAGPLRLSRERTPEDIQKWQQQMNELWNAQMRARNSLNSSVLGQLARAGAQKINL